MTETPIHVKVVNAFIEYLETGDSSLYQQFTRDEIQSARDKEVSPEKDQRLYIVMTQRIEELEQKETRPNAAEPQSTGRKEIRCKAIGAGPYFLMSLFLQPDGLRQRYDQSFAKKCKSSPEIL